MEKVLLWIGFLGAIYCLIYDFNRLFKDIDSDHTFKYIIFVLVWFFMGFIFYMFPVKTNSERIKPNQCFVLSDKDSSVIIYEYCDYKVCIKDKELIKSKKYNLYFKRYYNFMGVSLTNDFVYIRK
jgi:hypothetical protein